MKLGDIARTARSLAGSAIGRRGRWVVGIAAALTIGLLLRSHLSRIPLSRASSLEFLAASVVVALGSIFLLLPTVVVRPNAELTREQLLKARNDVRTAGIQILGGAVLLAGLLFTNRSLQLNRQGQITDRFTKATDQLGSEKLDIRLGGIYALERVARDSQADQGPVMEVLTAFVREHAPISSSGGASVPATTTVSTDVQAVLTVVARRKVSNDPSLYRPDLDATNLDHARLRGLIFRPGAYRRNSRRRVILDAPEGLRGAHLRGASLRGADLSAADLRDADLTRARLEGANLTGASLGEANLTGADLTNADLTGAGLDYAKLTGADLTGADLRGAYLPNARGLTQAQIDSAFTSSTTKLPAGLRSHS